MKIFGTQNAKTIKGEDLGYITLIRYLAPADESGVNVCPNWGACRDVCLYTAGRGRFEKIKQARINKTLHRISNPKEHFELAEKEITSEAKRAKLVGKKIAVRLNGTSDLTGDTRKMAARFPNVQFYDYTKTDAWRLNSPHSNIHYTLSYDPVSVPWEECEKALKLGTNVAMVFNDVPSSFMGHKVIDGDLHDLRFLDPRGVIVGLKAKGDAKKSTTAFVVKDTVY